MIENLKPYPEYKDSGLPWLGEVPAHWEIARGRQLFEIRKRIAGTLGYPVLSITQQGLRVKDVSRGEGQLSQDYSKYQLVKPGEFAMNAMDLITGGVGIAAHEGVTSPDYRVFAIRNEEQHRSRFYLLLFRMLYANLAFYSCGQGSAQLGRWRLPRKRFNDFFFPTPPVSEQASIARFLAWATNRLDRTIGAKRRIIALLQEQKQAIIHRAVTRGLDPAVPLKDSGIPWLGDVPEHWEVRRLKYLTEGIQMGPFGASLTELQEHDTGYKLYGQENTISGDFFSGKRWLSKEQFTALQRYELLPGDLVLTRKGSIGKCKIVPEKTQQGIADSDTIRVRLNHNRLLNDFGLLLLQDAMYIKRQIQSIQRGAILAGLNTATISNLRLAAPPPSEQKPILIRIQAETTGISSTMQAKSREIDLLREYRTRLIADVVTGKLDVREVAAKLPEEELQEQPDVAAIYDADDSEDDPESDLIYTVED
jgi:type I restriction enzyme S subunit